MATARKLVVLPDQAAWYHCISRCVRRGFWQGKSSVTGADCRHRQDWIEARLGQLSQVFAIDHAAFAVMDNHVHVVVRADPLRAQGWTAEEVAWRWLSIFPSNWTDTQLRVPTAEKVAELVADTKRLQLCRERLGNISWLMRCLNEWVARRANKEDKCTGRYWEGRFKCLRIVDAGALLMTMIYVDLNPVRAKIVNRPEAGRHTSVRRRFKQQRAKVDDSITESLGGLLPIEEIFPADRMHMKPISALVYLQMVDAFGRKVGRRKQQGAIASHLHPVLRRLGLCPHRAPEQIDQFGNHYHHLAGSPESLRRESEASGRNWLTKSADSSLIYLPKD